MRERWPTPMASEASRPVPRRTAVAPRSQPAQDLPPVAVVPDAPFAPYVSPEHTPDGPGRLIQLLGRRYRDTIPLEPNERRDVIAALFFENSQRPPFLRRFAMLMAISVTLAAFGLIADSTVVIIGAMLVAPLMAPVLAAAAAVVMGWPNRIRTNLVFIGAASAAAVTLAAGIGFFGRGELDPIPAEVLARTAPNLLDLGTAAAGGAAGAYSYVRKHAADALAGAAVAVALVPPLAVVGLMLQIGEYRLAAGAGLLFLANVSGVLISGAVTFLVAGLVPGQRLLSQGGRIQDGLRWAAIATIIVVLPIHFGQGHIVAVPVDDTDVESAIDDWVEDTGDNVETVDVGVGVEDGKAEIDVVIATPNERPPVDDLAEAIAETVDQPVTVDIQVVETERSRVSVDAP